MVHGDGKGDALSTLSRPDSGEALPRHPTNAWECQEQGGGWRWGRSQLEALLAHHTHTVSPCLGEFQ